MTLPVPARRLQASSLRQTMPRFAPTKAPRSITFKSNDKSTWPGPGSYNY